MYTKIFKEIVSIMHEDYAGCQDKKGWDNPDTYRRKIEERENTITPPEFVELVNDYLIDFKDHHLHFKSDHTTRFAQKDRGFKVRRFEDRLFVYSIHNETAVEVGDAILELDGIPISKLRERHHRYVNENHAERENWNRILLKHDTCTIQKTDGTTTLYTMKNFVKPPLKGSYRVEELEEGPVLMTLTDFADPDAINTLIKENRELLDSCESLIIDVRENNGGSDSSFNELIPYIFPEGETKIDDTNLMLFNCTERTSDLVVTSIDEEIQLIKDENARGIYMQFRDFYKRNRGKGFVNFDLFQDPYQIMGSAVPKNVIILTDVYCGSSGDSFVEMCKLSSKTTVVGRATAGLNDYSNLAIMKWNSGFELWYGTSKLKRVDDGKGMSGIGIEPDIYIPWTPEHLKEDVDMKKAIELINRLQNSVV